MTIIGFILLFGLFPYAIGNVGIVGGNDAVLGQFPYQGNLLKGVIVNRSVVQVCYNYFIHDFFCNF
jgi:hypothetical protein